MCQQTVGEYKCIGCLSVGCISACFKILKQSLKFLPVIKKKQFILQNFPKILYYHTTLHYMFFIYEVNFLFYFFNICICRVLTKITITTLSSLANLAILRHQFSGKKYMKIY